MDEILLEDAVGQAAAIRRGEVSAVELTEAYLARIDGLDKTYNAFVSLDVDRARATAAAVDAGERPGPVAGATFSVKDVIDVAGLPTTHATEVLADNVAASDSPIVRRFRDAGLVLLGKTNIPEFCSSMTDSKLFGPCRNPWDTSRTAGGSSGGAGAAVAAGLCSAAHGTDGSGSVRGPAAYCGLVGIKPTRGLVAFGPLEGPTHFSTSESGVLGRSVRDVATLLDALAAPGPWTPARERAFAEEVGPDAATGTSTLRVGVCTTAPHGRIDDECAEATRAAGRTIESLGHHVDEVDLPWHHILPLLGAPQAVPGPAPLIDPADLHRLEPRNVPGIEAMHRFTVVEHYEYILAIRAATVAFCTAWDEHDVIITPTLGTVAPPVEFAPWHLSREDHVANFGDFAMPTHPFSITGQPAISVPLAVGSGGLPIGVQLVGRHLAEGTLLRLCAQLEQASPWQPRLNDLIRSLQSV